MSEPLLEELIAANDVVNVDRVMALTQVMIYRRSLYLQGETGAVGRQTGQGGAGGCV